jgi:hypothetical protein
MDNLENGDPQSGRTHKELLGRRLRFVGKMGERDLAIGMPLELPASNVLRHK